MHRNGQGTPKNNLIAYVWYNIAASQGDTEAADNRDIIEKEMSRAQISEAQKLSSEYYKKYVE